MINMSNTTTALAASLETTPRTLRKFLRAEGMGVGKGSRYALPSSKREVNALQKRFITWSEARSAAAEVEVEAPEVDEVD
jgi:hypothetical protein